MEKVHYTNHIRKILNGINNNSLSSVHSTDSAQKQGISN